MREVGAPAGRGQWITAPAGPLDHDALLTLARKLQAAAADADRLRVRQAASGFVEALERHLRDEAGILGRVVPAQARILEKGQGRIWKLASELADDAGRGCGGSSDGCEARVQQLLALLSLQAEDERHAWAHRAA